MTAYLSFYLGILYAVLYCLHPSLYSVRKIDKLFVQVGSLRVSISEANHPLDREVVPLSLPFGLCICKTAKPILR